MQNFKIISIEGVVGVGKTTQCTLLINYLKDNYKNCTFKIFNIDPKKPEELCKNNDLIDEFLKEKNNIAILDGTVASMVITSDIVKNHYNTSIQEMELQVKSYLNLIHKYKTINCLIAPDSINYLQDRTGLNSVYLSSFVKGFEYFENSQLASNLKYSRVNILDSDKILQVFEKIKKTLNI